MKYVLKKLGGLVVACFVTSVVVFGALVVAPGDPVSQLAGGRPLSMQQREVLIARYNLDDPIARRYLHWAGHALRGDFGTSIAAAQPVSTLIKSRLGTTVTLVLLATCFIVVVSTLLGVLAARRPGVLDDSILLVTTVGIATPSFVIAVILLAVFAVQLGWFPVASSGGAEVQGMVLPAVALAAASIGFVTRTARTSMRTEQRREYVATAVSRGVPESLAFRRHVLRNALIPITTAIGLSIASMIAGTTVVEVAFGLNGLGSLLVTSVLRSDFPTVQAVSLLLVVAFVIVNTLVDVLSVLLDPRLEVEGPSR